ncbi:putative secreted protein (Por secretion system target) [Kordia periserrulae]|uniref:Putative secreted protein (Por secretion system target) n=1 Tax=Kordia periserrulae TaxID=701523 RepID=A0A2T6C1Q7_9FLAO|nr:T9SS type A sorting domain-containing protein [Kordia periserrulae]PTX62254.1 putative secreted protein (Por secretion system target) [Kordia periserrulae]
MKKNYITILLTLVIIFACCTIASAQIIADGTYKIFNTVNTEVMSVNTIPQGNPGNPDNLIIGRARMASQDANDDLQLWTFTHQGNDIYTIQNVGDNTYLGVKDGWCGVFGDVQVGFADTSDWIFFKVSATGITNKYTLEIAFDAACNFGSTNVPVKAFDIDGGNSEAKIQTFDVDGMNQNQQFEIVTPASLSIDEVAKNDVKVIYNPQERSAVLTQANAVNAATTVTIIDVSGRQVRSPKKVHSQELQIDFNGLTNGLYFIQIENQNKRQIQKVLVF